MTSQHERNSALEAVERIANRSGESVVAETVAVLRRLYPDVELRGTRFEAADVEEVDRQLLERATLLVSYAFR